MECIEVMCWIHARGGAAEHAGEGGNMPDCGIGEFGSADGRGFAIGAMFADGRVYCDFLYLPN